MLSDLYTFLQPPALQFDAQKLEFSFRYRHFYSDTVPVLQTRIQIFFFHTPEERGDTLLLLNNQTERGFPLVMTQHSRT